MPVSPWPVRDNRHTIHTYLVVEEKKSLVAQILLILRTTYLTGCNYYAVQSCAVSAPACRGAPWPVPIARPANRSRGHVGRRPFLAWRAAGVEATSATKQFTGDGRPPAIATFDCNPLSQLRRRSLTRADWRVFFLLLVRLARRRLFVFCGRRLALFLTFLSSFLETLSNDSLVMLQLVLLDSR